MDILFKSPPTFVHCGEETQSDQEFEREFAEELGSYKKYFEFCTIC